jgi:PucR family transcriptional regulator, purine catabolism regulatory protein
MATAGSPTTPARPKPAQAGPAPAGPAPGGPVPASQDEARRLRKLVAMCSHLSALASQTTDLVPIVEFLADSIGAGVAVVDRGLEVLACARVAEPAGIISPLRDSAGNSKLRTVLTAADRHRRALAVPGAKHGEEPVVVAPVSVGEDVAGYMLTLNSPDLGLTEDMRLLATEHAAMVCGIVLGRDLVVTAAAGRARQQLIEGLLLSRDREDREVERWARHLGLDRTREYYVMTIAAPAGSPVELLLARHAPDAIVATRADEVVAIVPARGNGRSPAEQGRALAQACAASDGQALRAGIGNPCATAAEISRSYTEARRALAAGQRMGQASPVTAFADLGIHRLLLRVPEVGDLRSFADEVLGALAGEERATGIDYLATLAVYFRENGSPRRAAQRLQVHPNTVSYRIRRIEELTGLSLDVHRDRLMAEVAVEILDGLERP